MAVHSRENIGELLADEDEDENVDEDDDDCERDDDSSFEADLICLQLRLHSRNMMEYWMEEAEVMRRI